MNDEHKTKEQLIAELEELRRQVTEFEAIVAKHIAVETALKQAEQEKQTILDNLVEHVVYHDMEMRILWANRAACDSVGMTREELLGCHCYEIWAKRSDPCEDCPVEWARKTGQPRAQEKTTPDGRTWYIQGSPVRDSNSDIVGILELTLDISEHKRAEEALRESEAQYRALVETIPHGIQEIDPTGIITFTNSSHNRIFGYVEEQMIGKSILDLQVSDSLRTELSSYLARLVKEQPEPIPYIAKNLTKGGRVINVQVDWNYKRDNQGRVTGFTSVVTDITERKQAEEALRESERRYRQLVENLHEGIWVIDKDAHTTFVNPRMAEMLGYSVDEMQGSHLFSFMDEGWIEIGRRNMERRKQGIKERHDFEFLRKDGTRIYATLETSPLIDDDGNYIGAIAGVQDITERKQLEEALRKAHDKLERQVEQRTAELVRANQQLKQEIEERKQAEKALRESEEKYRELFENESDAVMIFDAETLQFEDANPATLDLYGYSKEEFLTLTVEDISAEEEKTRIAVQRVKNGAPGSKRVPLRYFRKKDGAIFPAEICTGTFISGGGKKIIGAVRDITERKRAEDALQESEATLKAILAASPVGIGLARNRILAWTNKAMYRIWGYEEGSLLGKSTEILYPDAEEYERVGRKFYSDIEERGVGQVETRWVTKDGREIHCHLQGSPLDPSDLSKGVIVAAMDISELKRAQEKLLTYQEQLRTLASKLVLTEERERRRLAIDLHDSVGQFLAISKLKVDALRNDSSAAEFAGDLNEIGELTGQAIQQTRSLTFDLSPPALYELGLEAALESLMERMQKLHDLRFEFVDDNQPKPLSEDLAVLLYRAVQEVLVNVVKHARARTARTSIETDDKKVRVTVRDDGVGFDVTEIGSHVDREGKFGLFSIRERLHHLGGRVEIATKPGQGTQVTLVAPLGPDF